MCRILYNMNCRVINILTKFNETLGNKFLPKDFETVAEYCSKISEA